MAKRSDAQSVNQASIPAREAVQAASDYISAITGRPPTLITGIKPSDKGGWIVEVEMVEDRRIPPSADMLALYEIEVDADGDLLVYHRTHRYMRGNALSPMQDDKWTVNGDENVGPP
jgi:Gas vesicle synthesis protein GvpO